MEASLSNFETIEIKEEIREPSESENEESEESTSKSNFEKTTNPEDLFHSIELETDDLESLERLRATRKYIKVKKIEEVRKKIETGLYTLEQKTGGRSDAWKKFQVVVDAATGQKTEFVQCKICEYIQKYTGTSTGTSQLLRHSCMKKNSGPSNPNKHCLTIILKSCVDFCAMDLQPLTVLKGIGFEKLAQHLINIGAKLGPTRIEDLMPSQNSLYIQISQEVHIARQELFSTVFPFIQKEEGAISLNTWLDDYTGHSYTNVVFHHIDDKWDFNSSLMFTVFNSENKKTTEEIWNEIVQKFIRLGAPINTIESITFVSDQSLKEVENLKKFSHIPCVEVTLNKIIQTVLYSEFTEREIPEVHHILTGISSFVKFLHQSGLSSRLKQQIPLHEKETWREHLHSLKLIVKQYDDIFHLFQETDGIYWFMKCDIIIAEGLIKFLQLFDEVVKDLIDDHKPNIHLVLLWYKKILNFCAERAVGNVVIKKLKARTSEVLNSIFPINYQHKVATFLWSSVRKMKMLSDVERSQFMQQIQVDLNILDSVIPEEKDPLAENEPPDKRRKIHFHQWLENLDDGDAKNDEISNYLTSKHCNNSDLLIWWKQKESKFPKLARLAKKYLCIPATKRYSEKFFEPAKILIQNRSADMKPSNVIDLNYLHYFYNSV